MHVALDRSSHFVERVLPRPRVYMLDLLPTVPYYTGHLCTALQDSGQLRVELGCMTYHLDRSYFTRHHLPQDPALLDFTSRWNIPAWLRRMSKMIEYLINLSLLLKRFERSKPDVLHVQFLPLIKFGLPFEEWFLRRVQALSIPIVYTVHNVLPQDTGMRHRAAFRRIYHLATRLICHDQSARDRLEREFGVEPQRLSIVPHGPLHEPRPSGARENLRERLGVARHECLVLCQGIIRPYKGIPFLLDAWQLLRSRGIQARLAVVGNGDAEILRGLRGQIVKLGIEDSVIQDFRFVSVEELEDYSHAADVLVYPYREITTSGALMTGILYGKAIVATEQPAFAQVLRSGENALLLPYGHVRELADQLTRLIQDPALRQRLGEAARKNLPAVPRWNAIASDTCACYQGLVMHRGAV